MTREENIQGKFYLTDKVRLRAEYFGGLVFDQRNGTTLEVDKAGFALLAQARKNGGVLPETEDLPDSREFIERLRELNIISEVPAQAPRKKQDLLTLQHPHQWLSAPETVHWAVTYRCKMNCPDCYARRIPFQNKELNTDDAKKLIEKIARWQVFQLAIGGGEPLEREDIQELVKHAADSGLIIHLTTGQQFIDSDLLEGFSGSLTSLQFGIHAELFHSSDWRSYLHDLSELRAGAMDNGIRIGANICLNRGTIEFLTPLVMELYNIGLQRFTMLRYKPPASEKRWHNEIPFPRQLMNLKSELSQLSTIPGIELRLDCALSFLQKDLPENVATEHGIIGCSAGNRIASIAPDGSLYPCSQLVVPPFNAGNLAISAPDKLWHNSKRLRRFRLFRNAKSFTDSHCGVCETKNACGGCRAFADDALGCDPGCPDPPDYSNVDYDMIADIQDSIGHTTMGFPYATAEEIAESLKPKFDSYPSWIIKQKEKT